MIGQVSLFTPLLSVIFELAFYLTMLCFVIYTLFLAYHWFAYGTHRSTALLALAVYLLGSAPFLIVMAITF